MPSYVNIGAYVGSGTMVDTWATVGSCAQIGRNVHLSGGVGIGGVLEPLQASPTIIEDDCFIGARSEVVEGVIVGAGSVLAMGVFISQSTRIYDRATGKVTYGKVPPGSVVVPGSLPSGDGRYSLACAIIVKQVDAKTRAKTGHQRVAANDGLTTWSLVLRGVVCAAVLGERRRELRLRAGGACEREHLARQIAPVVADAFDGLQHECGFHRRLQAPRILHGARQQAPQAFAYSSSSSRSCLITSAARDASRWSKASSAVRTRLSASRPSCALPWQ